MCRRGSCRHQSHHCTKRRWHTRTAVDNQLRNSHVGMLQCTAQLAVTDRISGQVMRSVVSVRPSVRLFQLKLINQHHRELKVKVIGQPSKSRVRVSKDGNAVSSTSIRGQFAYSYQIRFSRFRTCSDHARTQRQRLRELCKFDHPNSTKCHI